MKIENNTIKVRRLNVNILANSTRVLARFLGLTNKDRIEKIISKILGMDKELASKTINNVFEEFEHRHFNFNSILLKNYNHLSNYIELPDKITETKKLLLGAYYTHEYSIEGAALFNPSIVLHSDQSNLKKNESRFILSLRAAGEGHISSIEFRTGIFSDEKIAMDKVEKNIAIANNIEFNKKLNSDASSTNYSVNFDPEIPISSRVLFPFSKDESNGMEDARFVKFIEKDKFKYYGTYTAYNGKEIKAKLIETEDFCKFKISELKGSAIIDKGMALFPEKVNGKYVMIGRQNGKDLSIMFSEDLYSWNNYKYIQFPERTWELTQIGNSGSPIKTKEGWLIITHAVGPMRKYVLSATLLDLNDPSKVIGSLKEPLISPNETEREGYVPNVIYTCGVLQKDDNLLIPYAMSDSATRFAMVKTDDILNEIL